MNKLVCSTIWLFATFFVAITAHSVAQTLSQDENNDPVPAFSDGKVLLFPDNDPYPLYIADPYRPTNAASFQVNTVTDITDSSGTRTWLAAGGRFGVLRITPAESGGRLWQISIEAGLDAQYDSGNNMDNIGYDGNYGLVLTTVNSKNPSLLFAYRHVSGHVGDEWLENYGRERIGYRRDELSIGTTFHVVGLWRSYGEIGYGFYRLNEELQRPWRFQTGIQRESPPTSAKNRLGWYAAADIQLHQERDWQPDFSVETGLLVNSAGRRWRIGVRYVAGRPPLTEFFLDNEQWLTIGLWMDF